ncbi:MAG: nucleotidyltransferase family protein [Prevotellaceae bacterium]|nr:nucleotidyltransferase family protein [Candidatus Minthosoma caballi]
MKTRSEYIDLIRSHADELRAQFGVSSLRLFGSVARNQHSENSDVDVCVQMPPRLFKLVAVGRYLEELLGCHVDVIREHSNMNTFLKQEIENDGIYIFN